MGGETVFGGVVPVAGGGQVRMWMECWDVGGVALWLGLVVAVTVGGWAWRPMRAKDNSSQSSVESGSAGVKAYRGVRSDERGRLAS